jgi:hypothetical protein
VPPDSAPVHENDADVELVRLAGPVTLVGLAGASVSTAHVYVTEGPVLPAASSCLTEKVWDPSGKFA